MNKIDEIIKASFPLECDGAARIRFKNCVHSALKAAGYAITPIEPNEAMLDAYVANVKGPFGLSRTVMSSHYKAMLDAATDTELPPQDAP